MSMCVAFGCSNRKKKKNCDHDGEKLSFHFFPKNSDLKEQWIKAIRRENWKPSKHSVICSEHFIESDFDRSSPFRTYLKKEAFPSVFPAFPSHLVPKNTQKRRILKRKRNDLSPAPSLPEKKLKTDLEILVKNSEKTCQKLKAARKKLRNMRLKQKRLKRKVAKLSTIISELEHKNFIQSEHCEMLNNISKTSFCLIRRESEKQLNPKMKKMFDERLKKFSTTLHFLSPKAYNFVRETFQTALPHPRTLSKWYSSINAQPGFSAEVFRVLKEKALIQPNLVVCLIFDAMAIRQRVDWDGKKLYGYMDLGCGNTDDGAPIANEVFVFHLVCMNSLWKIPLGYFFIKGITGEQINSLISQCLHLLSEINITVASITCDGTSSNFSSLSKFGCNFKEPSLMKTFFEIYSHHVDVFFDPAHMLKLVRNTLHDLRELTDNFGSRVSWEHLENLLKLQENEGLCLGNKIKRQHIWFKNQKMKVKLAAQLLSTSVADALKYCLNNKIKGFEDCAGTVGFIKIFNDLFDILNSRSIKEKFLKQAINCKNEEKIFNVLDNAEKYILGLKERNGKSILSGSRKTGFLGFLVCIKSMKNMYQRLVKDNKILLYVPMYKTSQDHLERLFGYVRGRGGKNDNPSAMEFCHLFRKIIVHKELHESHASSGNAIPLDKINFLGLEMGPKIDCEDKINLSIPKSCMIEPCSSNSEEIDEDDPVPDDVFFSNIILDIVEYIAGYVLKRLHQKLNCEDCLQTITESSYYPSNSLLSIKDRGGLMKPSLELIRICKACEKIIRRNKTLKGDINIFLNKLAAESLETNFFMGHNHFLMGEEDNHHHWLLQSIGKIYFTIRIKKIVRDRNEEIEKNKIRLKLKKVIHFKGQ